MNYGLREITCLKIMILKEFFLIMLLERFFLKMLDFKVIHFKNNT